MTEICSQSQTEAHPYGGKQKSDVRFKGVFLLFTDDVTSRFG
jgi:hypothetical protein